MKISNRFKIKLLILPVALLLVLVLINEDKYSESFLKANIHVVLQFLFVYGLISLTNGIKVIRFAILVILTIELFTKLAYGTTISVAVIMSVLGTSLSEAIDFVIFNLFEFLLSLVLIICLAFSPPVKSKVLSFLALGIGALYITLPVLLFQQELMSSSKYVQHIKSGNARGNDNTYSHFEYIVEDMSWRLPPLNLLRALTDTYYIISLQNGLTSSWTNVIDFNSHEEPKLLVIGLGESLRANNLGIYNYNRKTTPKLSGMRDELNIYPFAYSGGTNTWTSVPAMFTKADKGFDFSKSIINLANDAGYETYWLSNHGQFGEYDFSVSSLAKQATYSYFSSLEEAGGSFDSILLPELRKILRMPTEKSRLIVLHFYGSHMEFAKRYPKEFSIFRDENELLAQYDNTVLYTDYIQSVVIDLINHYGGEYLFLADHGLGDPDGEVPLTHDLRSDPSMDSMRVPFFTFPNIDIELDNEKNISLFYFECIFSKWSGISAEELFDDNYCDNALTKNKVSYVDSNLAFKEKVVVNN